MLHPSYTDLMQVANADSGDGKPVVSSRYSIVMAASKRARQLISRDDVSVREDGRKPLSVAVEELADSKIKIINAAAGDTDA